MPFVGEAYLPCDFASLLLCLNLEGLAFVLHSFDKVCLELLFSSLPHRFLVMVEVFVPWIFLSYFTCFLVLPILLAFFCCHMLVICELSLVKFIL